MTHTPSEIIFDKFEVIDCLKKDNHASVYLATHIYLGKKIILKTLDTDNLPDKTILARFKREAKILAQLDHPNLIKVLDFGTFKNTFYISFEYFDSRNLREAINQNDLTNENKKDILIQLLKALNIAHQNNVVHRDIKPENILINNSCHLKIADFGLAMVGTEDSITQDSSIVGTPGYMSPDQLRGEKTLHSDLFSAGVVAYELYTGKNPFGGGTISDTINKILNYNEINNDFDLQLLPEDVRYAINSLLRKKLRDRAKSALEVLGLLGIEGDKYEPVKPEKYKREKNPFRYHYAVIIILIILIIAAYAYNNGYLNNSKLNMINSTQPDRAITKDDSTSNPENSKLQEEGTNDKNKSDNPNNESRNNTAKLTSGKLFVECQPWADVYIDGEKIDTTPLKDYLQLKLGRHKLKLVHPTYPVYEKNILITSDKIASVSVDFNKIIGFLDCNIYPWGEIFISGESKGITPLRNPIALLPGTYKIEVKNPKYGEIDDQIVITAQDTLNYKLNFETTDKSKKDSSN